MSKEEINQNGLRLFALVLPETAEEPTAMMTNASPRRASPMVIFLTLPGSRPRFLRKEKNWMRRGLIKITNKGLIAWKKGAGISVPRTCLSVYRSAKRVIEDQPCSNTTQKRSMKK